MVRVTQDHSTICAAHDAREPKMGTVVTLAVGEHGMGADGKRAPTAELGKERSLSLDLSSDTSVVEQLEDAQHLVIFMATLQSQGSLSHLGHHR